MTDRQSPQDRTRYYWSLVVGCDTLHAWKNRNSRSTTYCGLNQFRSKAKPPTDAVRCAQCEKAIRRLERDKTKESEQRQAKLAKRRVSRSLEAIRPESVDPEEWRKAAKKLVRMV